MEAEDGVGQGTWQQPAQLVEWLGTQTGYCGGAATSQNGCRQVNVRSVLFRRGERYSQGCSALIAGVVVFSPVVVSA